ncbi:MAG TPA: isochorismatase family protein [Kofleriaceae bacterium]|nr:isochorismatase family protein [Kofleriaceae bacterium]
MSPEGAAAAALALEPARAALLIIDIQERLAAAMPEEARAAAERNVALLAETARRLDIPVVVSEQYPRGLGPTTPAVAEALAPLAGAVHRFDKLDFSVCAAPAFTPIWNDLRREQWIVCGMEAHVCVYQSVRDLCARGATVHVATDAITSRTEANRRIGIDLIERAGAVPTSTEVIVFDLLGRAGSDDFKALSKLLK